nr:hypothetical protein [Thalassobaculum litoreum]
MTAEPHQTYSVPAACRPSTLLGGWVGEPISKPVAQALDQVHSLVMHGHDDDNQVLFDEEQVVVLATMRLDPFEPWHWFGLCPAGRDPLAAEMKRVLIDVGLGRKPQNPSQSRLDGGTAKFSHQNTVRRTNRERLRQQLTNRTT